jgi:hypothetical protein
MEEPVLTVSFDEAGVMRAQLIGAITSDRLPALKSDIAEAKLKIYGEYQKRGAKFQSLIDLTKFNGTYVPEAMSLLAELMRSNKSFVEKSAAYGGSQSTNVAANILVTLAGRDNVQFFGTEGQAKEWLQAN